MTEPRRDWIEETHAFQVVVVGGGMAGLCAALASAREGAATALAHDRPVLGGNASTEIRVPISGAGSHNALAAETGVIHELILAERARSYDDVGNGLANAAWDVTLFDAVRNEPNLALFLNTHVYETRVEAGRVVEVVGLQLGSEKRVTLRGEYFIDCTGDGLVAAQAGVPFRIGQEPRAEYGERLAPEEGWSHTLGSSLFFRAVDVGRPVDFEPPEWARRFESEDEFKYRSLSPYRAGYWWIELGWPYDTIADNETLRDELLAYVLGVWDFIKNRSAARERMRPYALDWVGALPGKRESRRFLGAHVMTQPEIEARTLYPDRVAYGGWIIDDHTKEGIADTSKRPSFDDVPQMECVVAPYSVPLRSLHAANVSNLYFAGRLMSASRVVFNSLRVMGTLGVIGQAAGAAAARSAAAGRGPNEFTSEDVRAVQQAVLRQDGFIPRVRNEDPLDLARRARAAASSEAGLPDADPDDRLPLDRGLAQLLPVSAARLRAAGAYLKNATADRVLLDARLIPAEDVWDLAALDRGRALAAARAELTPHQEGWLTFRFDADRLDAPRLCWLCIDPAPGVEWALSRPAAPGLACAQDYGPRWWWAPRMFSLFPALAARTDPPAEPYRAENVVNGVARPECWTNLWMSAADQPLPQWVELEWPEPTRVAEAHVAFDTNVSRAPFLMKPAPFRSPECARDYALLADVDGRWETLVEVRGNYQRRRRHRFPPVATRRVRLRIDATNGAAQARVYEIRLYGPDAAAASP